MKKKGRPEGGLKSREETPEGDATEVARES